MAGQQLVNLGFGNYVLASRVVAIVNPLSSPMRRLRDDAKAEGRLVDVSQGRKTRAILVTDSNHVILSAISADTLGQRFAQSGPADTPTITKTRTIYEHRTWPAPRPPACHLRPFRRGQIHAGGPTYRRVPHGIFHFLHHAQAARQ